VTDNLENLKTGEVKERAERAGVEGADREATHG
jgi:hypothetical protein